VLGPEHPQTLRAMTVLAYTIIRGARTASACLRYTTNATAVCDACGRRK
jgi:hypothetical protein